MLSFFKSSLKALTKFEISLWAISSAIMIFVFLIGSERDGFVLAATLVGAAALIFTAKGNVIGQVLWIIFAVIYAVVSFKQAYYGEVLTYVLMTGGIATVSTITWLKNPYSRGVVRVGNPSLRALCAVLALTAVVTFGFYFILKALGTASLPISTLSVATSFAASSFALLRSPLYALTYTLNDVVLIVLWSLAAARDPSAIPMIISFAVFFINDIYSFINWLRIKKSQQSN